MTNPSLSARAEQCLNDSVSSRPSNDVSILTVESDLQEKNTNEPSFAFDENFIEQEVKRTWEDSRSLIHLNKLEWEYLYDKQGNIRKNKSGSYMGAPNFPKSSEYEVFFRGGADISTDETRTEVVNGIKMLPQFFWLKGEYIAQKLQTLSYL